MRHFPTIVNNIPGNKTQYENTLKNYALIDNKLASSQRAIGESSNLAQLALSYSYNFDAQTYKDNVTALSVLAQIAIDSSKRIFDVDINAEIKRIKQELDVAHNGYPAFWQVIRPGFNRSRINPSLTCPMNHIYKIKAPEHKPSTPTLPMSDFFVRYDLGMDRKKSRGIEKLIQKYSLDFMNFISSEDNTEQQEYFLLRSDFEELVDDIQRTTMPSKYIGLMSWLINRAFVITGHMKAKQDVSSSTMYRNKAILLKVLYKVNPEALLKCFAKMLPINDTNGSPNPI